jgi:hypothetical protein
VKEWRLGTETKSEEALPSRHAFVASPQPGKVIEGLPNPRSFKVGLALVASSALVRT